MRTASITLISLMMTVTALAQQPDATGPIYKITVIVDGVNQDGGNVGVLVFNSPKGWPENNSAALYDIVVPAHPGTVNVELPKLPPGVYALAIAHDVNQNHKLDKNWLGNPLEQWAMSNNPHATIKAPPFSAAQFTLKEDMEIRVKLQK